MMTATTTYITIQDDILRHMWLEDETAAYSIGQLVADLRVSDHIIRRALKYMAVEGLVSRTPGVNVNKRSDDMNNIFTKYDERSPKARLDWALVADQSSTMTRTPDQWRITERGIARMTAS